MKEQSMTIKSRSRTPSSDDSSLRNLSLKVYLISKTVQTKNFFLLIAKQGALFQKGFMVRHPSFVSFRVTEFVPPFGFSFIKFSSKLS